MYRVSAYLFFKYSLCYRLIFSISTTHLIYWSAELVLHDCSLVFIRHPSYITHDYNHISIKKEIMFLKWKRACLSFSRLKLKAIIRIVFFQMKISYQSSPWHCISIHKNLFWRFEIENGIQSFMYGILLKKRTSRIKVLTNMVTIWHKFRTIKSYIIVIFLNLW